MEHLVSLAESGHEDYGRQPWMDDREHAASVEENTGTVEDRIAAIAARAVAAGYPPVKAADAA